MRPQIQKLIALLEGVGFEFPVAIYPGRDPELGEVIEVDAFDVPERVSTEVGLRLGQVLWPVSFEPDTVLPGVMHDFESAARRSELPPTTIWYIPNPRSHSRA